MRYPVIAYKMNRRMLEKGIYNIRRLVFLGGGGLRGEVGLLAQTCRRLG